MSKSALLVTVVVTAAYVIANLLGDPVTRTFTAPLYSPLWGKPVVHLTPQNFFRHGWPVPFALRRDASNFDKTLWLKGMANSLYHQMPSSPYLFDGAQIVSICLLGLVPIP